MTCSIPRRYLHELSLKFADNPTSVILESFSVVGTSVVFNTSTAESPIHSMCLFISSLFSAAFLFRQWTSDALLRENEPSPLCAEDTVG